jgi:hypothetical protein
LIDVVEEGHLKRFRQALRGRYPGAASIPDDAKGRNELWALGRHHGLDTPLLDWTESPFVAAFFAFHEPDRQESDPPTHAAVFALHRDIVDLLPTQQRLPSPGVQAAALALSEFKILEPMADNPRLIAQAGLLTKQLGADPLEDLVQLLFDDSAVEALIKFILPRSERQKALRALNRMNINHLSLFPDLTGSAQYCNLTLDIDGY